MALLEVGKLALSPKFAALIADQTGAAPGWLLRNDLSEPMRSGEVTLKERAPLRTPKKKRSNLRVRYSLASNRTSSGSGM